MSDGTSFGLDNASVGDHVVLRHRWQGTRLLTVKAASKTRVTLSDDSEWSRRGRPWGKGGDVWMTAPRAQLVTDLDKVNVWMADERAERDLQQLREKIGRLNGSKLTADQCKAILAIAEGDANQKGTAVK